jgi:hypothetical protein
MSSESSRSPNPHADDPRDPTGAGDAFDPPTRSPDAGGQPPAEATENEDFDDDIPDFVDPEVQHRLWLRAVVPLLQLRSHETDPSQRVQFALDQMYIAACERVARLLRSDLADQDA